TDHDTLNVAVLRVVHNRADRVTIGQHRERIGIPKYEIGFRACFDSTQIWPSKYIGSTHCCSVKNVACCANIGTEFEDLSNNGCPTHGQKQRLSRGIGAKTHIAPPGLVAVIRLHDDAVASKHPRLVYDSRP